jgi:short-subunit dehydrogenase
MAPRARRASWQSYFAGKRVWVTGASSGIGQALVQLLGSADVQTLASARREDRLEALAAQYPSVQVLPLDLAATDRIAETAARAWDLLGGVDVLINNAGISQRASFVESDPEALERVIDVDLKGTMRLTHAVASRMLRAGTGHLAVVSSAVTLIPAPLRSAYAAAKMGLHGLFDVLRSELGPHGISVSIVVPGFVRTEISQHAVTATGGEHGQLSGHQASGDTPE